MASATSVSFKGDVADIIEANHSFHRVHNAISDNEEALEALERTNTLATVLRTTYGYCKERIVQVSAEHHEMIACFEKRDAGGVVAVHAKHCENGKSTMLRGIPEIIEREL